MISKTNGSKKRAKLDSSLSYYLNEINKIPLLTREKERELALRIKNGDKEAKKELISHNLRFVVTVARKYKAYGMSLSDLINEGNIGLIIAVDKFDVDMGNHFISYAVWWIRQSILKAICEKSRMIKLPLNRANELVKILHTKKMLEDKINEEVKAKDIAKELNYDVDIVEKLLAVSKEIVSLDNTYVEENGSKDSVNMIDIIKDEKTPSAYDIIEKDSLENEISSILNTLDNKERNIIELRYGFNGNKSMSLRDIGKKHNLTKERIRQIEKKTISKLKQVCINSGLEMYAS